MLIKIGRLCFNSFSSIELSWRHAVRAHEIMTPQVITVGADTTIVEAIKTMLRHQISGLPVVDEEGRLIGIISESDFIRRAEAGTQHKRGRWLSFFTGADRVAAQFAHEHGRKVGDIMTPNPRTVPEGAPLDQVVQIMESGNVKRVPVMRGDQLVGMITRSDFLDAVASIARHIPDTGADDDDIRNQVITSLQQAPWQPRRLRVTVRDGVVSLRGVVRKETARKATVVMAENVPGVRQVLDHLRVSAPHPPGEEDYGGGDFVSLQRQPSTADDEPL
jgi:CBS domain-containing protein